MSSPKSMNKMVIVSVIGACLLLGVGLVVGGIVLLAPARPKLAVADTKAAVVKQNVVLIVLDALRMDRVFAQRDGKPLMPCLAEIAARSRCFTHAWSPCSWTRPAMASIFTSLHVDAHQVYYDYGPVDNPQAAALPDGIETMAGVFRKAKFTTLGVQTNGNLVPNFGFASGFDCYDYLADAPAGDVTDRALARVKQVRKPFFLYVHYIDPHAPYMPPEAYREGVAGLNLSEQDRKTVMDFMPYLYEHADVLTGRKERGEIPLLSPAGQDAVRLLYDGEARYLDDQLRRLMVRLGDFPDTYVFILADHGEHFWEHDQLGHGLSLYEELVHVPLLMMGPGIAPGQVDMNVETVGVLPTMAELVKLPVNPAWQGRSLLHTDQETPVFSFTQSPAPRYNVYLEAVRVGNWKLILDRKQSRVALYDLATDPGEVHDLSGEQVDRVRTMTDLLEEHRAKNIAARGSTIRKMVGIDSETLQEMIKQGYRPRGK